MTADEPDEGLLARNVIDVYGAEAATVARDNARRAALAGQPLQAKSWIRVLGTIQRHQNTKRRQSPGQDNPLSSHQIPD